MTTARPRPRSPPQVREWVSKDPRFAAVDRAIGKDGFRVVALLRLSPLLPLAASNYIYGLTSVDLTSYVLGSWLGMLPGEVGRRGGSQFRGSGRRVGAKGGRRFGERRRRGCVASHRRQWQRFWRLGWTGCWCSRDADAARRRALPPTAPLAGTFAYVAAGMYGKELLREGGLEGAGVAPWQLLLAVGMTGLAVFYIGRLAKTALAEVDPEAAAELEERSRDGEE